MNEGVSDKEAAVLTWMMENLPVKEDADVYGFEGDRGGHNVGAVKVDDESPVTAVFTLGSLSESLFVSFTDGPVDHVAAVLAELEAFSVENPLQVGDTVRFGDLPFLEDAGRVGVLLMAPEDVLEELSHHLDIGEAHFHALLVVFVSSTEYEKWRTDGFGALLDHFEATDRDLSVFAAA